MEKAKRVSVKEAAEILGIHPNLVREGMRQGTLPIGSVIENEKNYSYLIYEEKIRRFLHGGVNDREKDVLDSVIEYINRLKQSIN